MFTAALLTVAKTQKQPKCPSVDEWIRCVWYMCVFIHVYIHIQICVVYIHIWYIYTAYIFMWGVYIHTHPYIYLYIHTHTHIYTYIQWNTTYPIIKNKIFPFATTWMHLEDIMFGEINQTEKDKRCILSLICGI